MACFFSAEDIATLHEGRDTVPQQFRELQERFYKRTYRSDRGREYAVQGFCRRLDELRRAVDYVFTLVPPELEDIPDTDDVVTATMFIQSSFINVSGCL